VTRQAGPAIVLDRSSAGIAKETAPLLLREEAQARSIPPGIYSGSDDFQRSDGVVARAVLLRRPCGSEPIRGLAGIGGPS
jgi:hypothetical protein